MADIQALVENHRAYFGAGGTRETAFRLSMLRALERAILDREQEITDALRADLNKAPFEAYETEIGFILQELRFAIRHLSSWVKPRRVRTPLLHFPSSSRIYPEPYGVTLIMSPWNYPFQLTLGPLIGAIAAGNCAVLKPSEYSPHTAQVLEDMVRATFDPGYISLVRGGREANGSLLEQAFDYIFFTGSVPVGKVVMEAASRHLTPVTLELGGKSPCIVDETASIDLAARRIVWGKFLNAGQTCVAPDYLLVHSSVKVPLIEGLRRYIRIFYGARPAENTDYPKIINEKHYRRLLGLLEGETLLCGGEHNDDTRQIAPTVTDSATWDSPLMGEEIFGPLLPVLTFEAFEEAIATVNAHPKPLAFYLFTTDQARETYAMERASFGGGCVNDTVIHLSSPHLRFGGVGQSGMGAYHGKGSFDTFTHYKSVMKKSNRLDVPLRYPPFQDHLPWLKRFMK